MLAGRLESAAAVTGAMMKAQMQEVKARGQAVVVNGCTISKRMVGLGYGGGVAWHRQRLALKLWVSALACLVTVDLWDGHNQ